MQQATLIEKERFTQMQWDMEELRSKCLEVEMNLKAEQVPITMYFLTFILLPVLTGIFKCCKFLRKKRLVLNQKNYR